MADRLECGCRFDTAGDVIELCAAHRPTDNVRRYHCATCGERGHNSRSCGRKPVRR